MNWTPRTINWSRPARRDLGRLQPQIADRVIRTAERYATTGQGDVKKLNAQGDEHRLRVGDWRVTFRWDPANRTIEVIRVLPRGRAFRD